MIAEGRPRAVYEQTPRDDEQLVVYRRLLEQHRERKAAPVERGRADAIITLDGGEQLGPTLRGLEHQRGVELTSVLVLGAGQRPPDPADLARVTKVLQRASGPGRPAGWADGLPATTTDVVVLLPAGTVLDPGFVQRALEVLGEEPEIAYVTAFAGRGSKPWHAPFGNYALPLGQIDAGASVAVIRRSALLDALPSAPQAPTDEAALFARLAKRGAIGLVLHEPLVQQLPKRLKAA